MPTFFKLFNSDVTVLLLLFTLESEGVTFSQRITVANELHDSDTMLLTTTVEQQSLIVLIFSC